jgi:hypothetical protein
VSGKVILFFPPLASTEAVAPLRIVAVATPLAINHTLRRRTALKPAVDAKRLELAAAC